jgi:tagatose 6-phosphate kinase
VILCVCPSPAIDVTYDVPLFEPGKSHRVRRVSHRPGGKAVNVASVLSAIGEQVVVLAPVDRDTGSVFRAGLAALGVATEIVHSGQPTRRTVTVVDASNGAGTLLSEPSRVDCWDALADRFSALLPGVDVAVISGSLPEGAGPDALADMARSARRAGRPVIVDTSGPVLDRAVIGRPTVIKPHPARSSWFSAEAPAACYDVAVVTSLGADGLIAVDATGGWRARPARLLAGDSACAGDALVAGLARGLARGAPLPYMLGDGVALSAAAVVARCAGEVDLNEVAYQRAGVVIESLQTTR